MVPPNNLGPYLSGKAVNETQYRGMIGSLMYLTASRPDIQFSTCLCARYQANPKESHLIVVKRIFRYLKEKHLSACQLLGGKLVCWSAKKHQSVAMPSAKAEYVAAAGCCANILWMKSQLTDYDIIYERVPDNTSAIAISNNPVLHSRTKHIDIRYHFIRDHILKGDIELHFIPTPYQLADIFTKPLDEPTLKRLIGELEFSSHNTSSPEITPKEEHATLDKPESPFLLATQAEFTFEEIAFTTNNEVALLYPSHSNQEYFKDASNFISKCCLKEAFTRAPTQYKKYLSEFWYTTKTLEDSKVWVSTPTCGVRGDIGITTFRNALRAQYLPHSNMYVSLPSITTVDHAKLIWEDLIHKLNKKTRKKIVPYPRFISLLLEHMMPEYDNEELTINPTQVFSVNNWTLKPNQPEEPPFTTHMKSIYKLDVPVVSKAPKPTSQTEETEASKSKTGQSEKDTQSSSAKDKSPSHPSPPTPVVGEMHKEAQQAAGGPTSLGATSEEGAHPQLSSGSNPSVLVNKTKSAGDGLKTAHTNSGTNEKSRADDILKKIKLEDLSEFLKDKRSAFFTPDSPQDEPIIVTDESEEEDADKEETHDTSHDMHEDTSVPPPPSPKSAQIQELMAQARPSYPDVNQLTTLLVTSLKPKLSKLLALHNFASCLPTELKELPSKFTELSREIKELKQHSYQVAELKNIQWELPAELQALPVLFATVVENASEDTTKDVPLAGQSTASPAEGEKNTKDAKTNLKDELVDLLGTNIVTRYYKNKEDGSEEVISNLKTRLDQLTQTEQELRIDLNKPLKEQDSLNELNELANQKRKRTSDLKDHSRGRLLGSVPEPFSLLVLRRLGSVFTLVYAAVQKLKKDSWKELQFSLVDNSKLNVSISLTEVETCTDSEKITRKRSKLDKHGHGNGKSIQEPEESSKRFEYQVMSWQNKTYPRPLIGQDSKRNDTLASYKHTREEKFALKPLEKRHNYSGIRIATLAIRVITL
ncbi:hypothetical protein Tco_0792727 [Tanacetum coccineum]